MTPFRIEIRPAGLIAYEEVKARAAMNQWGGVEVVKATPLHDRKLAVCGGGPLLVHDLDELRAWDGEIWAINHTAAWLGKQGVRATFVSVDPILYNVEPVEDALISLTCDMRLFQAFEGKRVRAFEIFEVNEEVTLGGTSTVTRIPSLAMRLGFKEVHFFGCEGSYDAQTHVDRNADEPYVVVVRAGGRDYKAEMALYLQCRELAAMFRAFPNVYHNRSGGLVRAMVEHPDTWEVVGVSTKMKELLEAENGQHGMYEGPDQWRKAA